MTDPATSTRTVTCTTAGCANHGIPILVPDDGSIVFCGPCGTQLTDDPQQPAAAGTTS